MARVLPVVHTRSRTTTAEVRQGTTYHQSTAQTKDMHHSSSSSSNSPTAAARQALPKPTTLTTSLVNTTSNLPITNNPPTINRKPTTSATTTTNPTTATSPLHHPSQTPTPTTTIPPRHTIPTRPRQHQQRYSPATQPPSQQTMALSQMRHRHTQGRNRIRLWLRVWDSSNSHIALLPRARNSNNNHSSILVLAGSLLRGLLGKYRNNMCVFVCRENVIPIQKLRMLCLTVCELNPCKPLVLSCQHHVLKITLREKRVQCSN